MATGKLWQRKPNDPTVRIPGSTYEVRAISARNIENLKKGWGKQARNN